MKLNHLETISEIAVRNELSFSQVVLTYLIFNFKVYAKNLSKGKGLYSPHLGRATRILTERYIENKKIEDWYKNKNQIN